jgi:CBS domain-containing protein
MDMTRMVAEVMTRRVATVRPDDTVADAARRMRDADAGDVIVMDGDRFAGILTDRDIAIRVVANDRDPRTPVADVCSGTDLATVTPDTDVEEAVWLMRSKAVRRLPVLEGGQLKGVVSLGDLVLEEEPDSTLADISAKPGNR